MSSPIKHYFFFNCQLWLLKICIQAMNFSKWPRLFHTVNHCKCCVVYSSFMVPILCFVLQIFFYRYFTIGLNASKVIKKTTTHFNFVIIYIAASPHFSQCLEWIVQGFDLSKALLSEWFCCDWSDGPVCCDWPTIYSMLETLPYANCSSEGFSSIWIHIDTNSTKILLHTLSSFKVVRTTDSLH